KMDLQRVPSEIFISYDDADTLLCQELEKHLSLLKREGLITIWHKGQISAGADKSDDIDRHLSTASVILLLLSADFVASNSCYGVQMQQAIARHASGEAYVIPIVLRPMDRWQDTPFDKLQALPSN